MASQKIPSRALILAAGRGSRMGALTAERPKCFVPLFGKPLLEWQMEALRDAGVEQIAIVTGYMAEQFQGRGDALFHNPRWAETNMVSTLACASAWLEAGPCVVSYADILYHPRHVRALLDTNSDLALTYDLLWNGLWGLRFDNPLSDAETFRVDGKNHLTEIGGRPRSLEEVQGQYMGLLKFAPAGWRKVKAFLDSLSPRERAKLDMTSLLRRLLETSNEIEAVPVRGEWCEVDSEQDWQLYQSRLSSLDPWSHDWRWQKVG